MSVSDLTNTTWVLNNTFYIDSIGGEGSYNTYNISFSSNNNNFTSISFMYDLCSIKYGTIEVAQEDTISEVYSSSFINSNYMTLSITGGTDATNSTLISWLEANATLQESGGGDAPTSTGKIGNLSIIKKHFGDLEIIKEVLNGATIYEAVKTYTITSTVTNGSYTGDTEISNTASVTISANTGYSLPSTISVSGATYTYDSTTGVISLSSPTGNVTIEATCVASYPVKGDIILLDLDGNGNKQYRVLKNVSGTIYEVMSMYDIETQYTSSNYASYNGSLLKTYLDSTLYNTFTTTTKNAIQTNKYPAYQYEVKRITSQGSDTTKVYNHVTYGTNNYWEEIRIYNDPNTSFYQVNVMCLCIKDIAEYMPTNVISTSDIETFFFNGATNTSIGLPHSKYGNTTYRMYYSSGSFNNSTQANSSYYNRYRFIIQIDLSKISFTKN